MTEEIWRQFIKSLIGKCSYFSAPQWKTLEDGTKVRYTIGYMILKKN